MNNKKDIKILNEGKKISKAKINRNEQESKKRTLFLYVIPLIIIVIVGIIYIFNQKTILLVIFGIVLLVVLFGGDCSSRTCPKCKKWNSVSWIKTERRIKKSTITKKGFLKKDVKKEFKTKYLLLGGKCNNCDCEFETQKNRII